MKYYLPLPLMSSIQLTWIFGQDNMPNSAIFNET